MRAVRFLLVWVLKRVFPVFELKESHARDAEPGKKQGKFSCSRVFS